MATIYVTCEVVNLCFDGHHFKNLIIAVNLRGWGLADSIRDRPHQRCKDLRHLPQTILSLQIDPCSTFPVLDLGTFSSHLQYLSHRLVILRALLYLCSQRLCKGVSEVFCGLRIMILNAEYFKQIDQCPCCLF